ncbi:protein TonB [Sphingomonas faeni]|uniref:Protein TonB n=1 Tax=Sphingomonas faeni TaxID=185950 RepID=A0A2T5UC60_9SPHN|nr:hypothetical protein [Sphingomonas faeni]PTW49087.1 protein TonB [Sphingomonas faeni]
MRSAYHPSSIETRGSTRRRSAALVLTVIAHILIILLLARLAPSLPTSRLASPTATTFQMLPDRGIPAPAQHTPSVVKARPASRGHPSRTPTPPLVLKETKAPSPAPSGKLTLPIELLGGDELFKAADVAKLPKHPEDQLAKVEKEIPPPPKKKSSSVYGPGAGPNGAPVYEMVDWYRAPTQAEMDGYMPRRSPGSWGRVTCLTAPNYHVENCRTDGEYPLGSGMARAMRQAAWQFRVLPPKKDGKPMIGVWMHITIYQTENGLR